MFDWFNSAPVPFQVFLSCIGILFLVLLCAKLFGPSATKSDADARKWDRVDDELSHERSMEDKIVRWKNVDMARQALADRLRAKLMLQAMREPDGIERQILLDRIDKQFPPPVAQQPPRLNPPALEGD